MFQIGELIARPWKSAWTPVEVEERELSLYLQLFGFSCCTCDDEWVWDDDMRKVQARGSAVILFVMRVKERMRSMILLK